MRVQVKRVQESVESVARIWLPSIMAAYEECCACMQVARVQESVESIVPTVFAKRNACVCKD